MYKSATLLIVILFFSSCVKSQNNNQIVGGPCEGCEAVFDYGNKILSSIDTLPEFMKLPKPILVHGKVYKPDGKSPASNVILYVYHTNDKGKYPSNKNSKGWESRHGYLRGWIKTDNYGKYAFYTSRPASYPNSNIPQHIHITVKESDKNEYYIEDFYFRDDPNITQNILSRKKPRGGSGVILLKEEGEIQIAKRDIILGLNIPNYKK